MQLCVPYPLTPTPSHTHTDWLDTVPTEHSWESGTSALSDPVDTGYPGCHGDADTLLLPKRCGKCVCGGVWVCVRVGGCVCVGGGGVYAWLTWLV